MLALWRPTARMKEYNEFGKTNWLDIEGALVNPNNLHSRSVGVWFTFLNSL